MASVAVIGLGNMGRGMAHSLRRGGHAVKGYDSSAAARARLVDEGFSIGTEIAEALQGAEMAILSLPTADIVEAVTLHPGGIAETGPRGLIVVDTTTSHPETSRKVGGRLAERGIAFIDAPVSGGPKGAITGTMTMVMGGEAADVARAEPILACLSAKRVHVGPWGAGHLVKLVNNLLCAAHLLTAAEALRFAQAAGVDPARMLEGLNAGSGRSGVTQVNVPTWILNGAFDSGFTMKLMRKDVALAADVLKGLGLDMPMARLTEQVWAGSAATIADDADFNRIVETQFQPKERPQ